LANQHQQYLLFSPPSGRKLQAGLVMIHDSIPCPWWLCVTWECEGRPCASRSELLQACCPSPLLHLNVAQHGVRKGKVRLTMVLWKHHTRTAHSLYC